MKRKSLTSWHRIQGDCEYYHYKSPNQPKSIVGWYDGVKNPTVLDKMMCVIYGIDFAVDVVAIIFEKSCVVVTYFRDDRWLGVSLICTYH